MSIVYKDNTIKKIYYQGNNIKKAYKGTDLVFSSEAALNDDVVFQFEPNPETPSSWSIQVLVYNNSTNASLWAKSLTMSDLQESNTLKVSDFETTETECYITIGSSYCLNSIKIGKGLGKTSIKKLRIDTCRGRNNDDTILTLATIDVSQADFSKITSMKQWITEDFTGEIIGLENINTSSVIDFNYVLYGSYTGDYWNCYIPTYSMNNTSLDLSSWDVRNVTSQFNTIAFQGNLKSIDVSNWDWQSLQTLTMVVGHCTALEEIKGIEYWNVSNTTAIGMVLWGCPRLKSINLSYWHLSQVTSQSPILYQCPSLETINISNIDAYKRTWISPSALYGKVTGEEEVAFSNLKEVIVTNVADEYRELIKADLDTSTDRKWSLKDGTFYAAMKTSSKVTNVTIQDVNIDWYIIEGTTSATVTYLDTYEDGSTEIREESITVSYTLTDRNRTQEVLVTSLSYTVEDYTASYNVTQAAQPDGYFELILAATPSGTSLFKYNINTYVTTQDYAKGDTLIIDESLIGTISTISSNPVSFTFQSTYITGCLLLNKEDDFWVSLNSAFYNNTALTLLDIATTTHVVLQHWMCQACSSLKKVWLPGGGTFQGYGAFYYCTSLTDVITLGNTPLKGINLGQVFAGCTSLSVDVSNWHPSTSLYNAFYKCKKVTGLSTWDISQITELWYTLSMAGFDITELQQWDVSTIPTMEGLFYCTFTDTCNSSISYCDLSKWNTSKLTGASNMFAGDSALITIDISNFMLDNATTADMFYGCTSLQEVKVTNCTDTTKSKVLAQLKSNLSDKNWVLLSSGTIKNLTVSSSKILTVTQSEDVSVKCSVTTASIPISVTTENTYDDGTVDTVTTTESVTVTFDANTTSEEVTRTGTATYEGVEFTWTVTQAAYAEVVIDWGTDASREFSPNPDSSNVITYTEIPSSKPTLSYTNASGTGSFTSAFLSTSSKYGTPADGISGFKSYFEHYYSSYGSNKYTVIGNSSLFTTWINAGYSVMWGFIKDISVIARYSGNFKCAGPKGITVKGIIVMDSNVIQPAQYANIAIKEPDTTTSDGRPAITLSADNWYTSKGFLVAIVY